MDPLWFTYFLTHAKKFLCLELLIHKKTIPLFGYNIYFGAKLLRNGIFQYISNTDFRVYATNYYKTDVFFLIGLIDENSPLPPMKKRKSFFLFRCLNITVRMEFQARYFPLGNASE